MTSDVFDATSSAGLVDQEASRPTCVTVIEPRRGWARLNSGEIWRYRELLYFLALRDLKVRYKQTALGAAWAILQPLLTVVVFSVVFGHYAAIPSDGAPYPIFSYAGVLPWTFFAYALGQASSSLVGNANLVSKVYFPRLVIPLASTISGLVDFAIACSVLIGMMLYFGVSPSVRLVLVPAFIALALTAALAVGIWLSALNVRYRDVKYAIPFLTQLWLFATPVAYPASMIHGSARLVLALNPMTGVVEGTRWAILGREQVDGVYLAVSVLVTVLLLAGGLQYFRSTERYFADTI